MTTTVRQLGMIPSWQFNADPRFNPSITDKAITLAQYNQQYVIPAPGGLGYVMVDQRGSTNMGPLAGALDIFRAGGWAFDHRMELAVGGVVLMGLGVLGWIMT